MAGRLTRAESALRRRKAVEMRLAAIGYQDIADELGFSSVSGAWKAVQQGMREFVREPTTSDRLQLEVDRDDAMIQSLWPKARRGNIAAIETILKIQNRVSRYMGLDAGQQIGSSTPGGSAVTDIRTARAKRRANAEGQQSS